MKKRVLTLVLALVMAVGALPTGAWAADTGDTLIVADSEAKVVTDQQKEQVSAKVAKATKNTGGKPTQTQSQTVGESGDGPSAFATNTFYWNVSEGALIDGVTPKSATLYTNKEYYNFNIWWIGNVAVEKVELFVKHPSSEEYSSYSYYEFERQEKSYHQCIRFYEVGAFSYYWKVTYKKGSIQKLDETNVSVYKGDNYVLDVNESRTGGIAVGNGDYFWWERKCSDKARNLALEAYAAEGEIKKFRSDNKKVTVNNKGKVTIAKKFAGEAIISVYLPATKNFNSSVDYIVIDVIPKTPTITKISSPQKGQMKVSWKKDTSVSGYEIIYSTDKKFLKAKSIKIKKNSASSVVVKGLKSRKKYYVKMYSYKGTKSWYSIDSNFSKTKSIKVK